MRCVFGVIGVAAALTAAQAAVLPLVPAPRRIALADGTAGSEEIKFCADASLPPEGYRLRVNASGATVASSDAAGAFYARQTLTQLPKPWPCLEIEDATKGRLDCYDAVIPPKPNPKAAKAKGVADCRFSKEEDERLACFNSFAESIPRLPRS